MLQNQNLNSKGTSKYNDRSRVVAKQTIRNNPALSTFDNAVLTR